MKRRRELPRTPCGYPPGPIKASDGTVYEVLATGQMVRREFKMTKAELKRNKRARRRTREGLRADNGVHPNG